MIYAENILICIAVPLAIVLFFIYGNARRFVAGFLVGMAVCLLSAYYSGFITVVGKLESMETSVYISPIVEEIMKLLPLLFSMYIFRAGDEELFMAAMGIGAGFATFENCCHILSTGAENLAFIMIRGLAVGVMHIVCVLILALSLVLVRKYKALTFPAIVGAAALSTNYHALYNLLVSGKGASSYLGYVLPMLTVAVSIIPYSRMLRLIRNKKGQE